MRTSFFALTLIFLVHISAFCEALSAPVGIVVNYTEKAIEVSWDSVPCAIGYNLYTARIPGLPLSQRTKVNAKLIRSGARFTYIWDLVDGKRERLIKGYRHYLSVTAVDSVGKKEVEGNPSEEKNCDVFEGYERVISDSNVNTCLVDSQRCDTLPLRIKPCTVERFAAFMQGDGRSLMDSIHVHIDPLKTGGCVPISTMTVMLLGKNGIDACRAEGTFLEEFHSFVIVNIRDVQCVLDFAADQFVPETAPVLIPRNRCFLDTKTARFALSGRPAYNIQKLVAQKDVGFSDSKDAELYKAIINPLMTR